MTPSNNPNGEPLIYRIADALGVFHLVAPVDHHHSQDEIDGLADALAAKANAVAAGSPSGGIVIAATSGELARSNKTVQDLLNAIAEKQNALTFDTTPTEGSTNPVTSGGVKDALDEKANTLHGHTEIRQTNSDDELALVSATANEDGDLYIMLGLREVGEQTKSAKITYDNIANLTRALSDPDSTPTVNSTKLVTSGGVKAAIDNAIAIRYYPALSRIENIFGDVNLQKVDCGILNSTGSESSITDLFILSHGQTLLLPDNAPTIPNGKMVLLHLYRTATQGQFMVSIGGIYTKE